MNKKYLSLGLAAAVLVALFAMALHDPLRFPVINRVVTAVITPFAAASSAVGGWVDDTGEAMTTVKTLRTALRQPCHGRNLCRKPAPA